MLFPVVAQWPQNDEGVALQPQKSGTKDVRERLTLTERVKEKHELNKVVAQGRHEYEVHQGLD